MPDDSDTKHIQARLAQGGTAADIAEEGYRVCRLNASLRRDLDDAKDKLTASLLNENDAARVIRSLVEKGAPVKDITDEAYRVCLLNSHLMKTESRIQADLRMVKQKMAVKDDALSEMRAEYPAARKFMRRAWELLQKEEINIPDDMQMAYRALMTPDGHDWQRKLGLGKDTCISAKNRGKSRKESAKVQKQTEKVEAKETVGKSELQTGEGKAKNKEEKEGVVVNTEPEESNYLFRTHQGRMHDMGAPPTNQNLDSEPTGSEPKTPLRPFNKRKATGMEGPIVKKPRIDADHHQGKDRTVLDNGEIGQ
jgi:hypothetical protein